MEIKKTTNYKKFIKIKGNRQLDNANLNKLKESINKSNLLEINPIIVNEKFEVIDGQHRLSVAKQLNLPIYYYVASLGFSEVVRLNTASKTWNIKDFALAYAEKDNNEHYEQIIKISRYYTLPITRLLSIINSNVDQSQPRQKHVKAFKDGEFTLNEIDKLKLLSVCSKLKSLQPYFSKWNSQYFVQAMMKLLKNPEFDINKLIKKLQLKNVDIEERATITQYLRHLEEIYNFGVKETNRRRLF